MTRGVDFLRLYQEFGLQPSASVDELKLAYRRFVSTLHPDRHGGDPISQHLAQEHLAHLTRLYDAAIRFHREHGRLPGAAGPTAATRPAEPMPPNATVTPTRNAPVGEVSSPDARSGPRPILWVGGLIIIGALVWLVARLAALEDALVPEPVRPSATAQAPAGPPPAKATAGIHVGMRAEEVLRVQGEPVTRSEYRWEYGPSWIQFDRGRVTEWYSSPLRALRIARTPPPVEEDRRD